jgi:putative transposase
LNILAGALGHASPRPSAAPAVPLHIIQLGNNRQACFYVPEDYGFYLDWLIDCAAKSVCRIHACVLMTNHVHLLRSSSKLEGPGTLMKALGQRYVQHINWTYRRSGTVAPCGKVASAPV